MNDIYDHAPECDVAIWLERAIETDAPRWLGVPDDVACQCQKLRACEQRVLESAEQYIKAHMEGKQVGFSLGVQAARDAVPHEISCWGSDTEPCDCFHASVVAAIDALRGSDD